MANNSAKNYSNAKNSSNVKNASDMKNASSTKNASNAKNASNTKNASNMKNSSNADIKLKRRVSCCPEDGDRRSALKIGFGKRHSFCCAVSAL